MTTSYERDGDSDDGPELYDSLDGQVALVTGPSSESYSSGPLSLSPSRLSLVVIRFGRRPASKGVSLGGRRDACCDDCPADQVLLPIAPL